MTEPEYTLGWILPFVRQAFKQTSEFNYKRFVDLLWTELEKAQVPGIVRASQYEMNSGQIFRFDHALNELRVSTNEAFFYLIRNGYIVPKPPDGSYLNSPNFHIYCITRRGTEWFMGGEPLLEDSAAYMKFLRERVPIVDPVVEQYVIEALMTFDKQAYFAAAVMLGAASEKAIYLLADAVLGSLKDVKKHQRLKKLLECRKLLELLEYVRDTITEAIRAKALPYSVIEGSATHLMSLFDAIRVQRNEAVHPMNAAVSADSVRLLIQSFPYAFGKSEELRAWFIAHPDSI